MEYGSNMQAFAIAFYYFSFNDAEKQKVCNFLRPLLAQLAAQNHRIIAKVEALHNCYRQGNPPIDVLKATLRSALELQGEVFLLVDALDECPSDGGVRQELCATLVDFSSWGLSNLHILATSRREPDIEESLSKISDMTAISIQNNVVDTDVELHVKSQLANDMKLKKWPSHIKEEIEVALVKGANGM